MSDAPKAAATEKPKPTTPVTLSKKPLVERFPEMVRELQVFLRKNDFSKLNGLRLLPDPLAPKDVFFIVGKKDSDIWGKVRRGRGYHSINRSPLLAELRRDDKLRDFFL